MKFGSLFSGIGGIDLGLERAGMHCAWQVENNEFCTKILAKHWPNVARFRDVRECGKGHTHTLAPVDGIAGGFPCQPHSLAGDRKASEDKRNLWPEFYRIICELRPRWILAENVLGLLSSEDGSFFGGILRDLAQARYDAEWICLRASDVGAPHQRERVFILAYTSECGLEKQQGSSRLHNQFDTSSALANPNRNGCGFWQDQQERQHRSVGQADARIDGAQEYVAHSRSSGWQECDAPAITGAQGHAARCTRAPGSVGQLESGMGRIFDGLPGRLDRSLWPAGPGEEQQPWEPPRVVTGKIPDKSARLQALGNAVVPQIAEYIGWRIQSEAAI